MFGVQLDIGTIFVLVFLIIFIISSIGFIFVKRNDLFGIKVRKSFESEEIWHKIHIIASICTIPFIIILFLLLFSKSAILKSILAYLIAFTMAFIYVIIPDLVTKKYFKEKNLIENKELEEQIKKESGWR